MNAGAAQPRRYGVGIAIDFHIRHTKVELFLRKIEMAEKESLAPFAPKNPITDKVRAAHIVAVEDVIARTKAG
jgi:hypothetical protein